MGQSDTARGNYCGVIGAAYKPACIAISNTMKNAAAIAENAVTSDHQIQSRFIGAGDAGGLYSNTGSGGGSAACLCLANT